MPSGTALSKSAAGGARFHKDMALTGAAHGSFENPGVNTVTAHKAIHSGAQAGELLAGPVGILIPAGSVDPLAQVGAEGWR